MKSILYSIFGSKNDRELKLLRPIVQQVNALESSLQNLRDDDLRHKTVEFRERIEKGEALDALMPEAFAVVREASKRVLGMRHFDVQLIGGAVLHQGKIAEMKTGEGKTLVATLAAYLNALSGKGVHVVTVNDYLARRDAEWMGRLYRFLGLEVGCIVPNIEHAERAAAYQADITYGQNNEFGFDYLRDNMKGDISEMVQRGHSFAIVDEVDSILVDEARVPLIISGPSQGVGELYQVADQIVRSLRSEVDYAMDVKSKQATLTEEGIRRIEEMVQVENLYDPKNVRLVHHVNQSLRAHATLKRDVDYVVRSNQVAIVDEFTGRLLDGRRWGDGLHQAVEAKEGVTILPENQTMATITFQNYFRMYQKLSGMTGTADTEALEFKKIYNLDVMIVPTNRPLIRNDSPDLVFVTENAKFKAVADEIEELVERGQPVLVGTGSIAKSEQLSAVLEKRGIKHHVLNAKQHEREAEIVAQAGRWGSVTISTNMAGRGTDILLGGNPEFLAARAANTRDAEDAGYQKHLEHFREVCRDERERVLAAGGLHILGTERHESRRIDNQLRGRSGRQGDPGSSRFYISLEDDLMRRFGGERMKALMARLGAEEDDAIESRMVSGSIERAQKKIEGINFEQRKDLLEYDDVLNKQRELIYAQREDALRGELPPMDELLGDVVEEMVLSKANEKTPPLNWDVPGIIEAVNRQFLVTLPAEEYGKRAEEAGTDFAQVLYDEILAHLKERREELYRERLQAIGEEVYIGVRRSLYLQILDALWKEHLSNMEYLKEGIKLRGYGQRNPLYEYKKEAFELFASMLSRLKAVYLNVYFASVISGPEEAKRMEEEQEAAREAELKRAQEIHASPSEVGPAQRSLDSSDTATQNRAARRFEARKHAAKAGKKSR